MVARRDLMLEDVTVECNVNYAQDKTNWIWLKCLRTLYGGKTSAVVAMAIKQDEAIKQADMLHTESFSAFAEAILLFRGG